MKIAFRKVQNKLQPDSPEDEERIKALPWDRVIVGKFSVPRKQRNYELLKLYWAICETVSQNAPEGMPELNTAQGVHNQVRWDLREFETFYMKTDKHGHNMVAFEYKSISYEKMTEVQMKAYVDRAFPVMARWLNIAVDELTKEGRHREKPGS